MKNLNTIYVLALGLAAFFTSGCAPRRPAEMPTTYPLCVVVNKSSAPLNNVDVTLASEKTRGNLKIGGTTDASGSAAIYTTYNDYTEAGAPEGEYRVLLSAKSEQTQTPALSPAFADANETPFSVKVEQGAKVVEIEVADAD